MKKITLFVAFLSSFNLSATIVVKDIADHTFTNGSSLNLDFNSDATTEFTLQHSAGVVGSFFDSNNINFVGTGTLASGHGWDIIKSLTINTLIGSSSSFNAQGDAYINAMWANTNEVFPAGDSYIGVKFKLGANTHYGWILVNSTGGANGVITIKSYAYNDIANQSINAGQLLSQNKFNQALTEVYPIPANNLLTIDTEEAIETVYAFDITGKQNKLPLNKNNVDISTLQNGTYTLQIITKNNNFTKKIIKN